MLRWERTAYPPAAHAAMLAAAEALVWFVTGRDHGAESGTVVGRAVGKKPCAPAACKQLCGLLRCLIDDVAVLRHAEAQDQVRALLALLSYVHHRSSWCDHGRPKRTSRFRRFPNSINTRGSASAGFGRLPESLTVSFRYPYRINTCMKHLYRA